MLNLSNAVSMFGEGIAALCVSSKKFAEWISMAGAFLRF